MLKLFIASRGNSNLCRVGKMLSTPGGLVGVPFELKLPVRAIIQLLSIAQLVEREIVVCYGSHASLQCSCGRWFESGWRDSGFALRRSDTRRDVTSPTHKRFPQGTHDMVAMVLP